jgi:hypothetical protein
MNNILAGNGAPSVAHTKVTLEFRELHPGMNGIF